MAIATTVENNLLLNAWQRVMLEEIWAFNQVQGKGAPLNDGCQPYTQLEREPYARALDQALQRVAKYLGYWPRPKWFTMDIRLGSGTPFYNQIQQTEWLKLIEFGTRNVAVIQQAAAIVYSDPNGDGINTLATITVPTTLTNPDEIQIFFRVSDGAAAAADARYQIEPATVSISGGNAVITAHRALFVKPSIWARPYELTDPNNREINSADTQVALDFVTAVDVYRVYNDTTTQVQALAYDNTVLQSSDGIIVLSDLGEFQLPWVCANWPTICKGVPVKLRVYYHAGHPLVYGDMDALLQEAIIRLSNTLVPDKFISTCNRAFDRWSQDRYPAVSRVDGGFVATRHMSEINPLGTNTNGATFAWDTVQNFMIPRGGKITQKWR